LFSPSAELGALQVIDATGEIPLAETVYAVVERCPTEVVMEATWNNGLRLRKTFTLDPTHFHVDLKLALTNESQAPIRLSYLLIGSPGLNPETRKATDLEGKVFLEGAKVKSLRAGSLRKGPQAYAGGQLRWVAGGNQYFAAALIPGQAPVATAMLLPGGGVELVRRLISLSVGPGADPAAAKQLAGSTGPGANAVALVASAPVELAPGSEEVHDYRLFLGPKKDDVLALYSEEGLSQIVQFGWFTPISKLLLFILKGFFKVTRSYGVAIILMTILMKAALLPLSYKGQTSMHRLQQIQPRIKELQDRHKGDKQKLGEEQLKLMREHGVNPFGGCLPMLLQFPVFIALFRALRTSFELRQRSFLWIDDLSQPDALIPNLPFSLPFLGNTLNLLPILWAGSMVLSQRLMPRPKTVDPQQKPQQMMMKVFPLFFGVMLYNFPAGLFLYFVTMSFLSIAEMRFIRKRLTAPSEPAPKAKGPEKEQRRPTGATRRSRR